MSKAASASGPKRQVNRLPAERRTADIMLAARAVFTEKGFSDASISQIALQAGVVEGSIYRFFANKRELLIRVIEHWYEEMLAGDGSQIEALEGGRARLHFLIRLHLLAIQREPGLTRLMLQEIRPETGYRVTRLFELNQSYANRVMNVVREAQRAGEFRADMPPALVRDMVYGCIEHRTWAFLRNEALLDIEMLADQITGLICRGLAADAGAASPLDRLDRIVDRLEQLTDGLPVKPGA